MVEEYRGRAEGLTYDSGAHSPHHALTAVKFGEGEAESIVAGLPDGRVVVYEDAVSHRKLEEAPFSTQYVGGEWHGLVPWEPASNEDGLIGVGRSGALPSEVRLVMWRNESLPERPAFQQTAPLARVTGVSQSGDDWLIDLRIWDGEGNLSALDLEYTLNGSSWQPAGGLEVVGDDAISGLPGMPGGVTHQLNWTGAPDLGPLYAGLVRFRVRASDVSLTGDWSDNVSHVIADTEFKQWCRAKFPTEDQGDTAIVGANEDPDGDLLETLLEYGLESDPIDGSPDAGVSRQPTGKVDEAGHLVLTFRMPPNGRSDLRYEVQVSTDAQSWSTVTTKDRVGDWSPVAGVETTISTDGLVKVEVTESATLSNRKFARLRVELIGMP